MIVKEMHLFTSTKTPNGVSETQSDTVKCAICGSHSIGNVLVKHLPPPIVVPETPDRGGGEHKDKHLALQRHPTY